MLAHRSETNPLYLPEVLLLLSTAIRHDLSLYTSEGLDKQPSEQDERILVGRVQQS